MADISRVKAVVKHIEKTLAKQEAKSVKPAKRLFFDMEDWFNQRTVDGEVCGTYMCFAGWGAHYAGKKMYLVGDYKEVKVVDGDELVLVEDWARDYFGFTVTEAEVFYATEAGNSISELKSAINYHLHETVFYECCKDCG